MKNRAGAVIVNAGLWALNFGNGTVGATNELFFTAGGKKQNMGTFGSIQVFIPGSGGGGGGGGGGGTDRFKADW